MSAPARSGAWGRPEQELGILSSNFCVARDPGASVRIAAHRLRKSPPPTRKDRFNDDSAFAVQRCGEGRAMRGIPRKRREYYADNYMKLMKTEWSHARVH